jgi:hypothetical protein
LPASLTSAKRSLTSSGCVFLTAVLDADLDPIFADALTPPADLLEAVCRNSQHLDLIPGQPRSLRGEGQSAIDLFLGCAKPDLDLQHGELIDGRPARHHPERSNTRVAERDHSRTAPGDFSVGAQAERLERPRQLAVLRKAAAKG